MAPNPKGRLTLESYPDLARPLPQLPAPGVELKEGETITLKEWSSGTSRLGLRSCPMTVRLLLLVRCPPCLQAGRAHGRVWGRQGVPQMPWRGRRKVWQGRGPHPHCCLAPLATCPESPLQGPDVSPHLLLVLLLLLQLQGLRRPLHPDDGLHVVLKPVPLHVGISTLNLIEHPVKSPEDPGQSRGRGCPRRRVEGSGLSAWGRAGTSHTLCRETRSGPPRCPAALGSAWGRCWGWS